MDLFLQNTEMKWKITFLKGKLDVIVSTSSLELGIDWDHVDQVILIGTPKNINRLIQRTGRLES